MEAILGFFGNIFGSISAWCWGSIIVLVLAKVLPNKVIGKFVRGLGITITLGLSRKFPYWNKIEKWFIDGLSIFVENLIKGLRSDNKKK